MDYQLPFLKGKKFPRAEAIPPTRELVQRLQPCCHKLIVAGSLRRHADFVSDIEIVFIPRTYTAPATQGDLFHPENNHIEVSQVDEVLDDLLWQGVLQKRLSSKGTPVWGKQNKLAVHAASNIPVDFFAATPENWANLVCCRTGPASLNMLIAERAKAKGWQWNPYGPGFSQGAAVHRVHSESDVFEFVGIPCREPHLRI